MPTRIQTINKSTPYVSLSTTAYEELDGFCDFLFEGHLPFANAIKINRDVSLIIDSLPTTYMRPSRVVGRNSYGMSILGYGYIQYTLLYDDYGKRFIHIFFADFGGRRKHIPSAGTLARRPLVQQQQKIQYEPTGEEFFGYKIGYCKEVNKYNILNKQNQPISKDPMQKKPRFFKSPFGMYHIIAHCNIGGWLWAMDMNGKFHYMHRMWKDAYLYEVIRRVANECLHKHLVVEEYRCNSRVVIKESQLRSIIREMLRRILLTA